MEILATTTQWGEFIFAVIVLSIIVLLMMFCSLGGVLLIATGESRTTTDFVMTSVSMAIFILFSILLFMGFKDGPEVTYKAKITDFNEVYNSGYEIVSNHGELYTLRKKEADR